MTGGTKNHPVLLSRSTYEKAEREFPGIIPRILKNVRAGKVIIVENFSAEGSEARL
ncbi:MAG: hypothetical protein PHQ97_15110 [Desulfobacterales bacterium]|nr:hypothetical protein [Desulfobacterales bacterium]